MKSRAGWSAGTPPEIHRGPGALRSGYAETIKLQPESDGAEKLSRRTCGHPQTPAESPVSLLHLPLPYWRVPSPGCSRCSPAYYIRVMPHVHVVDTNSSV